MPTPLTGNSLARALARCFAKPPTTECGWSGHGHLHNGPVMFTVSMGWGCGHPSGPPTPTCADQAQVLLSTGGWAHRETACSVCQAPSRLRVLETRSMDQMYPKE